MTMHMTRRVANGVAVLDLRGRLTEEAIEADSDRLRTVVAQLVEAGYAEIAVNLEGVTHLDACGLGELVAALRAARAHGGRLALVAPPPRVQRLLSITRLDTVFELCGCEAELHARRGAGVLTLHGVVADAQAAYA